MSYNDRKIDITQFLDEQGPSNNNDNSTTENKTEETEVNGTDENSVTSESTTIDGTEDGFVTVTNPEE